MYFKVHFNYLINLGGGWPLTMFLDENGVPFMGGTIFSKRFKNGLPSFKEVLQKVHDALKNRKTNIINQKDLIIKNLDLKNSVLSQDLEPIIEASLNYLDPEREDTKALLNFLHLIYSKHFYIFTIRQKIKNI